MSDLAPVGVRFVADGAPQFMAAVTSGDTALAAFGRQAQTTSGVTVDAMGRLHDAVTGQFVAVGNSADGAGGKLSGFGQLATKALSAVGQFALQALQQAGRAILDFAEGSIAAATTYDASMAQIVALTSTSADEVKQLSAAVLELAGQVGIGPQELADGLYFVASAGFSGADAMTILTASAKAAAAGLGETKTIADLTTSTLNAYGLGAEYATHVTDILVQAVKEGKAEPAEFASALAKVLPIAAAAGVNFEQVAASIATMTRVGLDANEAATALRGLLSGLEKPSVGAAKALQSVGLSADDVRKSIREKGLLSTLEDLMSRTNGNIETLGKIIPNVRALTGVLASAGSQAASYKTTLEAMNGAAGSTDRAFRIMTETAQFQQRAFTASMEALQIEVGQKLLPILGKLAALGASVATSLTSNFGPALDDITSLVETIANVIATGFVPALSGATVALTVYAAVQTVQALPAILEMLPALALQTEAFFASAAAATAAILPYALIAAAVAGVVYAYQNFSTQVADATQQLLESRPWWNASTDAITDYSHAIGAAKEALSPYAATISELRSEIESEIESLGKRTAAGLVSDAEYQKEMDTINAQRAGLIQVTAAYNDQEQALLKTAAASQTGTAQLQLLMTGEQQTGEQTKLTEKELEQLEKQIQKTFENGAKAVESYVNTEESFLADLAAKQTEHNTKMAALEKELQAAKTADQKQGIQTRITAEQAGYAQTEQAAAASYAKQQAAQRAHLGQMLSDYTLEQVKLGNISNETGQQILSQIETQFGQVEDISGRTFLQMTADIDKAAKSGGSSLSSLGSSLGKTTDAAVATKQAMDALAKKYEAELVDNFNQGKIDAHQLADALKAIPTRVSTEIVTHHVDTYESRGDNVQSSNEQHASGSRAVGGPVLAGMGAYLVGERGPELFVPGKDGQIITAEQTRSALNPGSGSQLSSMSVYAQQVMVQAPVVMIGGGGSITINQSQTTNMPLSVTTNQSPAVIQQSYYTARALAGA